jgi:hypothetical protein
MKLEITEPVPSFTVILTSHMGLNPSLHGEKPALNSLDYDTAPSCTRGITHLKLSECQNLRGRRCLQHRYLHTFLLSTASRPALGHTMSSIHWVPRGKAGEA